MADINFIDALKDAIARDNKDVINSEIGRKYLYQNLSDALNKVWNHKAHYNLASMLANIGTVTKDNYNQIRKPFSWKLQGGAK